MAIFFFNSVNSDSGGHFDYPARALKNLTTPLVRPLIFDGLQVFHKYGAWAECLLRAKVKVYIILPLCMPRRNAWEWGMVPLILNSGSICRRVVSLTQRSVYLG